jgi:multiple sugar transport system ATP-binding protein
VSAVFVESVRKSFGATPVLRGVSLAIAEGEFVSLVGPSGCGKTTLMRIIAGLETLDAGRVVFAGEDVTRLRAADRDVAMVFQNYALYPHLTAYQNMAVPLVMRRLSALQRAPWIGGWMPGSRAARAAIAEDVRRAAETLAIGHLLERRPSQLSGGQRQRVALGRAIVRQPHVFLMDEPLSNLDAALRVATRREIVELQRRVGCATIYVTHDQSEAMTMSDRVAVMMAGEILQLGTPEEIYADPADLRVASFVGSPRINTLPAEAGEDGEVRVGGVPVGLVTPARAPLTYAVRPEDLTPAREGLGARVEHVEFLGEAVLLHARHEASGEALIARCDPSRRQDFARGAPLALAADPHRALLFDGAGRRAPQAVSAGLAALV